MVKKLSDGYFKNPGFDKGCFGVAVINWLLLHNCPVDTKATFRRYETSPYTRSTGATNLLHSSIQTEYMTEGKFGGVLYHCLSNLDEMDLLKASNGLIGGGRKVVKDTFQEEFHLDKLIYSPPREMTRLLHEPDSLGVICTRHDPCESGNEHILTHAVVNLDPRKYLARSYIGEDGKVHQLELDYHPIIVGVFNLERVS